MFPQLSQRRGFPASPWDFLERGVEPAVAQTALQAYPIDVYEDNDYVHIEAELPGFKKDEVDVNLENGILTITAARQPTRTTQEQGQAHLNERRLARVHRSLALPDTVDEDNIEAKLSDGVLHLKLPKRQEARQRKIEVK